jgi:hypothetical protein
MRVVFYIILMVCDILSAEHPFILSRCIDTFKICLKGTDKCQEALDTFYTCADENCFSELEPDYLPST